MKNKENFLTLPVENQELNQELDNNTNTFSAFVTVDQLNAEIRARTNNDNIIVNSVNLLSNNYEEYKTTTNSILNAKQNSNDDNLITTNKNIVGAINELKANNNNQNTNINQTITTINQMTKEITQIKSEYSKTSDINDSLELKQNISDNNLGTADKTITGAINEIKTNTDKQETNINNMTKDITLIKREYVKSSDITDSFDTKQNKTDNNLVTTNKTVTGAINELKTNNDNQATNINQNTTLISQIKSDYVKLSNLNNMLELKQSKTDSNLTTTDKTITGAINEIKTKNDNQGININENKKSINQNFNEINQIKEEYAKNNDLNKFLDLKQNKSDDSLNTTSKTITSAINEIKSSYDKQETNINQITKNISENTDKINKNSNDINQITTNYIKISDVNNSLKTKQNTTDNNLTTIDKTVTGAINELKIKNDNQTPLINQNIHDINQIKTEYIKTSDANKMLEIKQNKTDDSLNTANKTISGAINEIKTSYEKQNVNINQNANNINQNSTNINQITKEITQIKSEYVKSSDANKMLDIKQNKTDNSLNTGNKTISGAINEIKTNTDKQETNINQITKEITQIKSEYVKSSDITDSFDTKQNKTDKTLLTTDKTVTGAINELKTNNDNQDANINQNSTNINQITKNIDQIKIDYIKSTDANKMLDIKQNIIDDNLGTNDKTIIGAINELNANKLNNNNFTNFQESVIQYKNITNNTLNIKQNKTDRDLITTDKTVTGAINELKITNNNQATTINQITKDITLIKSDFIKTSDVSNMLDLKQNKTDNNLNTINKTITAAINELKTTSDNQTTNINQNVKNINKNTNDINQNINDIKEIKLDYLKSFDANKMLDNKQNITDDNLGTNNKTVVGAINEVNAKKVSHEDFSSFQESVIQYENITNNTLNIKQNKTDRSLITNDKTVTGAINELKRNISVWTVVGFSQDPRFWQYNLVSNKTYQVAFHWDNPDNTTNKIYKEFTWSENTMSLETYIDSFSEITNSNIPVLGSANIVEILANEKGITIKTKIGTSKIGRIISLKELA